MNSVKNLFLLLLLTYGSFAFAQPDKTKKARWPYERGIIQYSITGDAKGQAKLTFHEYGWKSLEHREMSFVRYGVTSEEARMEITDNTDLIKINLNTKTGIRSKDATLYNLLSYKNSPEAYEAWFTSRGGKLIGTDTILALKCNKWEFTRGNITMLWEHQGLPLKLIKKLPGLDYEHIAIKIDTTSKLDPLAFQLPKDISWEE
ncbi:MAG: hypothetical protein ACJAVY_001210 [Marinoscillum sp.]|jgi:hypothetical protein